MVPYGWYRRPVLNSLLRTVFLYSSRSAPVLMPTALFSPKMDGFRMENVAGVRTSPSAEFGWACTECADRQRRKKQRMRRRRATLSVS